MQDNFHNDEAFAKSFMDYADFRTIITTIDFSRVAI